MAAGSLPEPHSPSQTGGMFLVNTLPQAVHLFLTSALATTEHGRTQSNVAHELDHIVQCKHAPIAALPKENVSCVGHHPRVEVPKGELCL